MARFCIAAGFFVGFDLGKSLTEIFLPLLKIFLPLHIDRLLKFEFVLIVRTILFAVFFAQKIRNFHMFSTHKKLLIYIGNTFLQTIIVF